ncbi:MAG TPA: collagen-binding domain-containing protein [Verrucomicrobiae bacterium]|jgi:hypothetical protein
MKISFCPKVRDQGSILAFTLILVAIMGLTLGSYLVLASGQQGSVARSQRWNSAIDVAEAGIEEGLAQVNYSPNDFSANNWSVSGNQYSPPSQRSLVNGSYALAVIGGSTPTIYATGYVGAPITGQIIQRTVRVTTQVLPLFNVALGAVGNINMNGNNMVTDSWNSESTNLSNGGQYTSSKVSTNGDVASEQGIVNIGNQKIDGNLYLGPTATYTSGANQVLGTINKDYNVNFPDVTLPSSAPSASSPTVLNTNGTVYNYLPLDNATYTVGNDNKPILVAAGHTNVTLIVTAQSFNPTAVVLLGGMTNPPTLTIYDFPPNPGGSVTLVGNGTGGASAARPVNFIFYGGPNLNSVTFGGTSTFIGAIYAPEAVLSLNGGGNGNNIEGALIVKNATVNGHFDVHYDEALAKFGPAKGFVASSWQEL